MRSYVMAALLTIATVAAAKDQRLSPSRAGEQDATLELSPPAKRKLPGQIVRH
jgi:hypothetical protein